MFINPSCFSPFGLLTGKGIQTASNWPVDGFLSISRSKCSSLPVKLVIVDVDVDVDVNCEDQHFFLYKLY
jgi:hypothetical protein